MSIYTSKNQPPGFYIYAYIRTDGTPYYIGKGSKKRAWVRKRNERIKLPKDLRRVIIMEANLTEIGAFALERFYIRWFGRKDTGTGALINLTDGGEGLSGRIVSPETRKKLSEAGKGKIVPDYVKEKMRGVNNHFFGGLPDYVKEKMKTPKINYNKEDWLYNTSCKPIIATHLNTGTETFFKSIKECFRTLQIHNISKVLKGKQSSAKGYSFRYA